MEQEYFCDTSYIDYFYKGLSPWYLDYLAATHGFPRPDLTGEFTYCELGCGTGLSLVLHAAANPMGRFYGIDINKEHIERAVATAAAGGLDNVTFLEENFAQLLEADLPRFDMVVLHGVYSWISPTMRREVLSFIGARLKPGGKVYISYNALPGWAAQAPLRDFMHTYVAGMEGSTLDKVHKGMEYLRMLRDAEAPFLQAMPQIKAEVEHILTADPRYVAHEYFTAHWEAFYFTKVAGDLARFGLKFVGCLPVSFNYGAFCLPEKLHDFFMTSKDRLAFETHKDFVLNTHFRRDVFCLGSSPGNPGPEARLDKVVVGSFRAGQGFDKEFQVGATNTVRLNGTVFDALAELLAGKALPVAAVLRHESLREFQQVQILEALECLLASEQVLPFAQGEVPRPTGLSALNRHLLQRDLGTSATVSLACEAAGTAVSLPQIDALMIWAIHEAGLEGAGAWMETWCQERQLQLNDAENLPSMQDLVRTNVHRLPLTLLGVVGH